MFYAVFGLVWTTFSLIFTWIMYFTSGSVTVNGEIVTREEFNAMLWPKIMMGIFLAIGIILFIVGMNKVIKDWKTEKRGEQCFGKLLRIYPSGVRINERPEYKVEFAVYIPSLNSVEILSEVIGTNPYNFHRYAFFNIKFLDGDINIGKMVKREEVPSYIIDIINQNIGYGEENNEDNIVEINGERYIKIDN